MEGIRSFLERFKNFTPPARAVNRAVRAAIEESLGIFLTEDQVKVSRGIAHIQIGGVQKSEIILHKEELLKSARAKFADGLRDIV